MSLKDPDLPFETLTRLLNDEAELTNLEKNICYLIFAGLSDEERARLSEEESIRKAIGTVVSPNSDEQQFDGSIPAGGDVQRPFLHLNRTVAKSGGSSGTCCAATRPR